MSNGLAQRMQGIISRIEGIESRGPNPYIHCSKINSIWLAVKEIPGLIQNPADRPTQTLTTKQMNAVISIGSILDQWEELLVRCSADTCVPILLSSSVSGVRYEVESLRDAAGAAFTQLGYPDIARIFRIPTQELVDQDIVDMKRIVQVLLQISKMQRSDATNNLALRFASLERLGLKVHSDDSMNISIPELPANLNLVLKHDDIILQKQIGKGIAGVVRLGVMKSTNEQVAVKILHRRALTEPELESFRREVSALAVLAHPSLLQLTGYTEEAPFYIVTPYMEHGSLFDALARHGSDLTPTIRSVIAYDVALGLQYLHGKGVIHRDMKSLNILLDGHYRARIGDFGMVRTRSAAPMTGLIGTAHWMAPEVLMSQPDYGFAVDVYSFGILLWELLTGDPPYRSMKQTEITMGVINGTLRPVLPDDCPDALHDLLQSCWAQSPSDRPAIESVVAALVRVHFPGTVEADFVSLTGIKIKKRKHRRARSSPDAAPLLAAVGQGRPGALAQLAAGARDSPDSLIIDGLARLVDGGSEAVLEGLAAEGTAELFDVEVLRGLLAYTARPDFARRMKALRALLKAASLRFEFLSSAPAFLVQLLAFFRQPIDPDLAAALLKLTKQLLAAYADIGEGVVAALFTIVEEHEVHRARVFSCISSAVRFDTACREVSPQQWAFLLAHIGPGKHAMQRFFAGPNPCPNDGIFVQLIYERRDVPEALQLLVAIAARPRAARHLVALLPTGDDTRAAAALYPPLLAHQQLLAQLAQIPEFYAVASYFVASGQLELICGALKLTPVVPEILVSTRLCEFLAAAFGKTRDDGDLALLMAAIFAISRAVVVQEFVELLPAFFELLIGSPALRNGAFLCIAALDVKRVKGIDYPRLVKTAAYYVNSKVQLVSEFAAAVLREDLGEPGVDVDECAAIFVECFDELDANVAEAAEAFRRVAGAMSPESKSAIAKVWQVLPT